MTITTRTNWSKPSVALDPKRKALAARLRSLADTIEGGSRQSCYVCLDKAILEAGRVVNATVCVET